MFFDAALANMVSSIKVGYLGKMQHVLVPVNKFLISILKSLESSGAITGFTLIENTNKKSAKILLHYVNGNPAINSIRLLSKKSNRFYIRSKQLKSFLLTRRGVLIISTSSGIMLGTAACNKMIGGEPLIWITY